MEGDVPSRPEPATSVLREVQQAIAHKVSDLPNPAGSARPLHRKGGDESEGYSGGARTRSCHTVQHCGKTDRLLIKQDAAAVTHRASLAIRQIANRSSRTYLSRALRCLNANSNRSLVASETSSPSMAIFSEKYRAGL